MKNLIAALTLVALAAHAVAQSGADSVAGIQLYPGGSRSGVEGTENSIKATGYPIGVCRRTPDSIQKVVAFYRRDKSLELLDGPITDSAYFSNRSGSSMSILSPWVDTKTLVSNQDTLVCIAAKSTK